MSSSGVIRVADRKCLVIRVAECNGRLDLVGLARGGARDVRNARDVAVSAVLPP